MAMSLVGCSSPSLVLAHSAVVSRHAMEWVTCLGVYCTLAQKNPSVFVELCLLGLLRLHVCCGCLDSLVRAIVLSLLVRGSLDAVCVGRTNANCGNYPPRLVLESFPPVTVLAPHIMDKSLTKRPAASKGPMQRIFNKENRLRSKAEFLRSVALLPVHVHGRRFNRGMRVYCMQLNRFCCFFFGPKSACILSPTLASLPVSKHHRRHLSSFLPLPPPAASHETPRRGAWRYPHRPSLIFVAIQYHDLAHLGWVD